jgi:acyl-CoA reductase-like NAD-dependent aldehyde dehydrogenase
MSMSNNANIQTVNPTTGKVFSSYDIMSIEQIEYIAKNAQIAFVKWKKKGILKRCDYIRDLPKYSLRIRTDIPKSLQKKWGNP